MNIFGVGGVGVTMMKLNLDGSLVAETTVADIGVSETGSDSQNSCVGPDGRIYFFPGPQMDVEPFALWQSIDGSLAGSWVAGPAVDDSGALGALESAGLNGEAKSGVFTSDGALNVVMTSIVTGGDAFLLRFPDPSSGAFKLVARWPGAVSGDLGEIGAFAQGTDVYVRRWLDAKVRKITRAGAVSVVLDASATDYRVGAPVVAASGRVLVIASNATHTAILSTAPSDPTGIDVLTSWVSADHPNLPVEDGGTGVLIGSDYYISSGFTGKVGRYPLAGGSVVAWADLGTMSVLAALPGTPLTRPPLRYYPRDDAVAGSPRTDRSSTSRQSTARQGWTNTYR